MLQIFNDTRKIPPEPPPIMPIYSSLKSCGSFNPPDAHVPYANCTDGDVRLNGGSNRAEGRLEVCFNHAWGAVCGPGLDFSPATAQVVCRQLGLLQGKQCLTVVFINYSIDSR